MKAIQMSGYGGPEVLSYADVADPVPGQGQVLVDIKATTVNPADWKMRQGYRRGQLDVSFPLVLGRDFSGVVSALGPGADLAVGDEVFGVTRQGQEGAYAEKIAVDADLVGKKPARLSHVEQAALALIGLTAIISLEDTAKLKSGETILIQGGAGGVGNFAIQLAHHLGATVYTTASARNHDYVKSLGADHPIDYNAVDFVTAVPPCDVVFDTVGGEVHQRSYQCLKPGGRFVFIAAGPEGAKPPRSDVEVLRPNVIRGRQFMDRITALVEAGAVRPPDIKTMKLSECAEAHTLSATNHVRGKIVMVP